MSIDEFSPVQMQIVMHAIEHMCFALKLTDSKEHLQMKSRVSALILECSEGDERDLQKLIDCAHAALTEASAFDLKNGSDKFHGLGAGRP